MKNCFTVLGFLRKTTNRPEKFDIRIYHADVFCKRVQFISLRVETLIFLLYCYKIRALCLIFKYTFLKSNPL